MGSSDSWWGTEESPVPNGEGSSQTQVWTDYHRDWTNTEVDGTIEWYLLFKNPRNRDE